jgi:NADH-quinone oxidoreductase subunit N
MTFMESLNAVLPEELLAIGGIILMLAAAWMGKAGARTINGIAVVILVAAAILANFTGGTAFDGMIKADAFSTFARVLIYGSAAVALMMAPRWFASEEPLHPEYGVLMLLAAAGMGVMVSANNLLALYVGIELNALAAYVLASFMRKDQRTAEAGLKYFVLGALASGMMLYGMSLLYGFSGSVQYEGIAAALKDGVSLGELFGIVFLMAGLAFKVSAVPFHMWTPDVYEGAPTPVTTFFASAPKVAAMAMLIRICISALGPAGSEWQQILIFMALASIVVGAVGAIGQTNIKRLMAYSSINNVGFALVGLAAAGTAKAAEAGVAATLSYMAIYVVMTLGAFACILQMRDKDGNHVESIASLSGLSQTNKPLAAALAILMFSLAGIPPLFGFWGKFLVFQAAVSAGLLPLAAIGIAASVIGAYYYLRIIKTMYFDEPAPAFRPVESYAEASVILVSSLVLVLGYLLIPVLDATSAAAARSLF